jgi:glycosyltransferase involved in cell wall biosynthesis
LVKISVLLCTYRVGGLDVSLYGLSRQTFPRNDYEVILCDRYYDERKKAVKEFNEQFEVPLYHCKPIRQQFPLSSGSMQRNSAICYAEGELCIFLCDFGYTPPEWLQRHWQLYDPERKTSSMGPHRYWVHPPLKQDWEKQHISIFEEEFSPSMLTQLAMQDAGQDPKLQRGAGPIGGDYFHMKNESVALNTLLQVNGADEGYDVDGGHAYSDMDLGMRVNAAGGTFMHDPSNIVEIIQVRDFHPLLQRNRDTGRDYEYFSARKAQWESNAATVVAPHDLDLKALREDTLKHKKKVK